MICFRWCVAAVVATTCLLSPALRADEPKEKPAKAAKASSATSTGLWDADLMMETAVLQLTKRYDLTKDQEEYTRKILVTRVKEFLKSHEADLRALLTDAIELQRNPAAADAKRMQEWADRALPVFVAARSAILDGNRDWGTVLNPEQKKIHQMDLDQMDANFKDMDEKFNRWAKGSFKKEDLAPRPVNSKPNDKRPGGATPPPSDPNRSVPEDIWELYVNQIIGQYRYNREQENSARGILQECRNKATRFRDTNKDKLADLDAKIIAANNAVFEKKGPPEASHKLEEQRDKLLKPITEDYFNELKQRVEALATTEQKAAFAALRDTQAKKLQDSRKTWEERAAKLKSPATQTAASQPAKPSRIILPPPEQPKDPKEPQRAAAGE